MKLKKHLTKYSGLVLSENETQDRLSQAANPKYVYIKATGLSGYTCDIDTYISVCVTESVPHVWVYPRRLKEGVGYYGAGVVYRWL